MAGAFSRKHDTDAVRAHCRTRSRGFASTGSDRVARPRRNNMRFVVWLARHAPLVGLLIGLSTQTSLRLPRVSSVSSASMCGLRQGRAARASSDGNELGRSENDDAVQL